MTDSDLPIPYVLSTPVVAEVLEQAATELDRQKREGWRMRDTSSALDGLANIRAGVLAQVYEPVEAER